MDKSRYVLTDAIWERIKDIVPGKVGDPGRTAADNRIFLEAVLWRARTGEQWRNLPKEFGKWNSVFRRYQRWAEKRAFDQVFEELSDIFDSEYVFMDAAIVEAHARAISAKSDRSSEESSQDQSDSDSGS